MVRIMQRDPPRGAVVDWLVAAVVLAVVALSVTRAFGPLTYDIDIWRQTDTATFARNYAEHGMQLFYPQIDWGGPGPGYVESELPIMPWLAAGLYLLFGEHPVIGRLLSLAFMLVATVAFAALVRRRLGPVAARWAVILFVVSPAFMRYATAFMPEATVLAFYVVALWAFDRWLAEDRPRWLVAAAASTALAGLAKPTSLHILIVLLVWLALADPQRLRRWYVTATAALALLPPALWLWHAHGLFAQYGNTFGVISGGDDKFGSLRYWLSPAFYLGNAKNEALWILGVVGVPLAVVGAWRAVRERPREAMLIGGIVGLAIFYAVVARYSESGMGAQYHVFSLPFAAVAVGLGVERLAPLLDRFNGSIRAAIAAVLVLALSVVSLQVFRASLADEGGVYERCADQLDAVSTPTDLVVIGSTSSSVDEGVPNNWQEPMIFYFADRRGWSLASDQLQPAAIAADQRDGARWFVAYDEASLAAQPAFAAWLENNAAPVRSIATDGCGVWRLGQ